ncbi:recombinase family protein [Oceanobacillus caeni]|uniref:recombinase family protein n=1 Tax=Oceanobacillus caeni TaxID=405946 RepID=UPI002E1A4A41
MAEIKNQKLGIDGRDIFVDKQCGKDFNRQKYQALKNMLREGDLFYIHSLDRFGRNSKEIQIQLIFILKLQI